MTLTLNMTRTALIAAPVLASLAFSMQLVAGESLIDQSVIATELDRTFNDPDSEVIIDIDAPRDFVFDFLINHVDEFADNADSLDFDNSGARVPGALGIGSERIITLTEGETLLQRFLMFDPPVGYAYHVDMARSTVDIPLEYSISRYQLSEMDAGSTRLEVSVVYESNARLLGFIIRRAVKSTLRREFEKAASIIEAEYKSHEATFASLGVQTPNGQQ